MPLKHEKFVAKVREQNSQHLEDGEQVEYAIGGQTGPVYTSPLFNLIQVGARVAGKVQTRLVVLTNRNVYSAYPGFFGQFEMKDVKAKFPRSEAAARLRLLGGRTQLEIDGERVHFRLGTIKHLRELVAAAGGQADEPEQASA